MAELRPFHTTGVIRNSSEGQLSPEEYASLMAQQVFTMKEGETAATGSERLNTAILGEKYGTPPAKKKRVAKEIIRIKAKKEVKAVKVIKSLHTGTTKKSQISPIRNKSATKDQGDKYLRTLLDELPDLDMTEPAPKMSFDESVIIDVDAPEPLTNLEGVADVAGFPELQPSLDNYTEYMMQHANAVREALHVEVHRNVSNILKGGKNRDRLEGVIRNSNVTRCGKGMRELSVRVPVSEFGKTPEFFTNDLLLLRSAGSNLTPNPGEPAKLIYGRGKLKFSLEDSDGMGVFSIRLRNAAYQQLVGTEFAAELGKEKSLTMLPLEIQWSQISSLTSAMRKTLACWGEEKNKPAFWEQICKGVLEPWPEAPASPVAFENLNAQQSDVVNRLVNSTASGIYYLIGPPGTGKTTTLVEAVKQLANKFPSWRILVVTPSNRAMQVDVETFISSAPEETLPFATVSSMVEKLPDNLVHLHEKNAVSHMLSPLSEVAIDINSEFPELVSRFKAAAALTKARINRVLRSPVGQAPTKNLLKTVNTLADEVEFTSVRDVRSQSKALVSALRSAFASAVEDSGVNFVLDKAQIHFATCVASGNSHNSKKNFDIVILDEASQCDLPEAMIPIEKSKPKLWLQFGDPKQLGAFAIVDDLKRKGYADSMLERAMANAKNGEVCMLTEQYRMHPAIRKWPSDLFYGGKLTENPSILTRSSPLALLPSSVELSGLPSAFVNVDGKESRGAVAAEVVENTIPEEFQGNSFSNMIEAHAIADTVRFLLSHNVAPESIAVISFYSAQVQSIKNQLNGAPVYVNTVDGSQGDEYDFVLISCVRSDFRVGFLNDSRRINVAMTRAKHACWVFGNEESLKRSSCDFSDYLDYIRTPARNNTSPPTGLLDWKKIQGAIKKDLGEAKVETKSEIRMAKAEAVKEKIAAIAKAEQADIQAEKDEKKAVLRAEKEEKKAVLRAEKKAQFQAAALKVAEQLDRKTENRFVEEVEKVLEDVENVVEKEVQGISDPAQPVLPDTSTTSWLTERMTELGYAKKMIDTCHEQLVDEQGFVQESLFAELPEAEFNTAFMKEIGITAKGAQLYLSRLHRELRERYFPQVPEVPVPTATKVNAPKTSSAAEIALPDRKTVKQVFAQAMSEMTEKVTPKPAKKATKAASAAEMAYPSRKTIEQVFAEADAERTARMQAELAARDAEFATTTDESSTESSTDSEGASFSDSGASSGEDVAVDDFLTNDSASEGFSSDDGADANEAGESTEETGTAYEREAKRVERRLAEEIALLDAASIEAKNLKKTRETAKLGMSARKANDVQMF